MVIQGYERDFCRKRRTWMYVLITSKGFTIVFVNNALLAEEMALLKNERWSLFFLSLLIASFPKRMENGYEMRNHDSLAFS